MTERENPTQMPQSFYNLVSEVTSYNFCHILFTRNMSLSPAHSEHIFETITNVFHNPRDLGNLRLQVYLGDQLA